MADPVSWYLISAGWKVLGSDGGEIGRVDEVVGDSTHDIFDGLAVATSALGKPRYVPAEQVGRIEEGVVHLTVTAAQAARGGEYLEPPATAEIEPGGSSLLHKLESEVAPAPTRAHSMSIWRRLWFWAKR